MTTPRFHARARLPDTLLASLTPDQAARLRAAAERADDLAGRSRTGNTLRAYRTAWQQWTTYCNDRKIPSLPAPPGTLAGYIAQQAVALNKKHQLILTPRGDPQQGRLSPASLAQHCSAIDRVHISAEHRPPGRHPDVRDVLRGARALFPPGPARNTPLTRAQLEQAITAPDHRTANTLLLLTLSSAGLTAQTITDLDDDHITADGDNLHIQHPDLDLRLTADTLPAPASTLIRHLRPGPVLQHPDGRRYTRQGTTSRLRTTAETVGLPLPPTGPPHPTHAELKTAAAVLNAPGHNPHQDRDRSLLTAIWTGAMRPGTAGPVHWKHTTPHPPASPHTTPPVIIHLTGEKQDRHRRGHDIALKPTGHPTGPAETWTTWHTTATRQLNSDPRTTHPDQPCWYRLNPDGTPHTDPDDPNGQLKPLTADAVQNIVRKRLRDANIPGTWHGGSLRSGILTTLHNENTPLKQIQQTSRHKNIANMLRYIQPNPNQQTHNTK